MSKKIILRNTDSSAYVELVTDMGSATDGLFTISEVIGLSDAEEQSGIQFKELAYDVVHGDHYSVGFFKEWATDNNYICELVDGLAGSTTTLVAAATALAVDEGDALTRYGASTGAAAVADFDATANVASNMGGLYFKMFDTAGNGFYVWANCDSANLDPVYDGLAAVQADIAGLTSVEVTLTTADTATEVADAIETAIEAIAGGEFADFDNTAEACTLTNDTFGDILPNVHVATAGVAARQGLITSIVLTTIGAQAGGVYSHTLAVVGGNAPYTWAISAGTIAVGTSLEAASGTISGTPTTGAGTETFTVEVTDAYGKTDTAEVDVVTIA